MDGPGGHHPEWGNSITKELTQSVLTDKWILAQKLRISKLQFAKHMKLKKKEYQRMDILFPLLRKGKVSTPWSSFLLNLMCFANCILYLGYSKFLGTIGMEQKMCSTHLGPKIAWRVLLGPWGCRPTPRLHKNSYKGHHLIGAGLQVQSITIMVGSMISCRQT